MNIIVDLALPLVAGICLFAGFNHLLIWLHRRGEWVHASFALLCLLSALYALNQRFVYQATGVDGFLAAHGRAVLLALLALAVFPWFASFYTRVRARRILSVFAALYGALALVHFLHPTGLSYASIGGIGTHVLPWGERVAIPIGTKGGALWLFPSVLAYAVYGFALFLCGLQWRRRDRVEALLLASSIGLILGGGLFDLIRASGPMRSLDVSEYCFVAFVVSMSVGLSRQFRVYAEEQERLNRVLQQESMERTRAEEELRRRERWYHTLFEAANDAIFIMEGDKCVECNPETLRMFGREKQQIIGETPYHFAPPTQPDGSDSRTKGRSKLEAAMTGTPQRFEWRHQRLDGTAFDAEVSLNLVELPTGSRLMAIVRDITDRKQAEEALKRAYEELEDRVEERTAELRIANERLQELDRLKSMFIASVSHELRTPLNSIIGFTWILLQGMSGELSATQRDQLDRVYGSAKHLLALISDVIDISKVEAGRVDLYPSEFSLKEVVDEAMETIRPQAEEKGLGLTANLQGGSLLCTDRRRVLQCLLNLLSNAVKYSETGEIGLCASEAGEKVEIAVTDEGIGIAEKDIPRLFNAFERLDSHLRIPAGGAGLGLHLTRKIAAGLLGGSVSVRSEAGKGSTFTLRVPKHLEGRASSAEARRGVQ